MLYFTCDNSCHSQSPNLLTVPQIALTIGTFWGQTSNIFHWLKWVQVDFFFTYCYWIHNKVLSCCNWNTVLLIVMQTSLSYLNLALSRLAPRWRRNLWLLSAASYSIQPKQPKTDRKSEPSPAFLINELVSAAGRGRAAGARLGNIERPY